MVLKCTTGGMGVHCYYKIINFTECLCYFFVLFATRGCHVIPEWLAGFLVASQLSQSAYLFSSCIVSAFWPYFDFKTSPSAVLEQVVSLFETWRPFLFLFLFSSAVMSSLSRQKVPFLIKLTLATQKDCVCMWTDGSWYRIWLAAGKNDD